MSKEKVRLVVEIDTELRDTLRLESALSGQGMNEIIERLITDNFPDSLRQIQERRGQKPPKGKRPKSDD